MARSNDFRKLALDASPDSSATNGRALSAKCSRRVFFAGFAVGKFLSVDVRMRYSPIARQPASIDRPL
jgi:hypothetical protein